jgi:diadenosine tetraphosphate (Ap4A) HIT family hydrolase
MTDFALDVALARDTFAVGRVAACQVRLMNNSALPWFIVIPEHDATELCDLPPDLRHALSGVVDVTARHVRSEFGVDKVNVAAIGNLVRQLHVHVVGRRVGDYCWPGVVWGTAIPATYPADVVDHIKDRWRKCCAHTD